MATTLAVVGVVGSLAGTAYSAYGQYQAGEQNEEALKMQQDQFAMMNDPARFKEMMSLFEGPGMAADILEGLGSDDILDYLQNPIPLTKLEKEERNLFRDSGPLFREIQGYLGAPIRDPLMDLLRTGFKTDIQPIVNAENQRFFNETIPGVAERFAGNLDSSGFEQALAQSAEDMGIYLGEREFDANEAASGRRMEGLKMAPGLFTLPLDFQLGYGQALGSAGERFRTRKESVRPGFRQLQAFPTLAGIESNQAFMLPGFQPGAGGGANPYASLLTGANSGALLDSISKLGKLFQTPTQPTGTFPTNASLNSILGTGTNLGGGGGFEDPGIQPSDFSFYS
jgi:hypothetical protein